MPFRFLWAFLLMFEALHQFSFGTERALEAKLKAFVQNVEEQAQELQGCALAILVDGKVFYKKTFGYTRIGGEAIHEDTLFGLASVAKPIVATSLAYLVKNQELRFEDSLSLPYLKHPVTFCHLLSHTTGYAIRGDDQIESGQTRKELLQYLSQQKPDFPAGQSFHYSNLLYSLVEDALKQKGLSLKQALAHLNKALGKNIFFYLPFDPSLPRAAPYSRDKQAFPFPSLYQKHVISSAGLFASLNGMIQFLQLAMGYRQDVLSASDLQALYQPRIKAEDISRWKVLPFEAQRIKSFYGMGWRIFTVDQNDDTQLIFHGGYINGVTTFMGFMPAYKIGYICLSSQTSPLPGRSGLNFWKTVVDNNAGS